MVTTMPSTASKVSASRVEPEAGKGTSTAVGSACGGDVELGHAGELGGGAGGLHPVAGRELARAGAAAEDEQSLGGLRVGVGIGVLLLHEEAVEHVPALEQRGDDRLDPDRLAGQRRRRARPLHLADLPRLHRRRVDGRLAVTREGVGGARTGGRAGPAPLAVRRACAAQLQR
jgi:hypothetical protein